MDNIDNNNNMDYNNNNNHWMPRTQQPIVCCNGNVFVLSYFKIKKSDYHYQNGSRVITSFGPNVEINGRNNNKLVSANWIYDNLMSTGMTGWINGCGTVNSSQDAPYFTLDTLAKTSEARKMNTDPCSEFKILWVIMKVKHYVLALDSDTGENSMRRIKFRKGKLVMNSFILNECSQYLQDKGIKSDMLIGATIDLVIATDNTKTNTNNTTNNVDDLSVLFATATGKQIAKTGDGGYSKTGDKGKATSGNYGIAISGDNNSYSVTGKGGISISGNDFSNSVTGKYGKALTGSSYSIACSDYQGVSICGNDFSTAISGDLGFSIAGKHRSTAITGFLGAASAGIGSTINIWDRPCISPVNYGSNGHDNVNCDNDGYNDGKNNFNYDHATINNNNNNNPKIKTKPDNIDQLIAQYVVKSKDENSKYIVTGLIGYDIDASGNKLKPDTLYALNIERKFYQTTLVANSRGKKDIDNLLNTIGYQHTYWNNVAVTADTINVNVDDINDDVNNVDINNETKMAGYNHVVGNTNYGLKGVLTTSSSNCTDSVYTIGIVASPTTNTTTNNTTTTNTKKKNDVDDGNSSSNINSSDGIVNITTANTTMTTWTEISPCKKFQTITTTIVTNLPL